jgi:4-amino-4-deoxy-L-arabinose transferase-like glycosyltransferase
MFSARIFSVTCADRRPGGDLCNRPAGVRRLGSRHADAAALAFTIVIAVNPLFLHATARAWNHDTSLLAALVAFALMLRANEASASRRPLIASGIALGVAIGIRSSFACWCRDSPPARS